MINHISQLAAIVPPTNNAKQKAPNRIISFGSDRWVIPKTTDVNSENSSTPTSSNAWLRLMWGRDVIYVFEFLDEILELLRRRIGLQKLLHDIQNLKEQKK